MKRNSLLFAVVLIFIFIYAPVSAESVADDYWQKGTGIPGINGIVYDVIEYNGQLIAGGAFDIACDTTVNHIAAWDGDSWKPLDEGFTASQVCRVYALAVYEGRLIAGGVFSEAGGVPVYNIAAWDGISWTPLEAGTEYRVYALEVYNGTLVAAGNLETAGGITVNNIASWNGAAWDSLGSGIGGDYIRDLTVYDGILYAGGSFDTAGECAVNNIACWNGASWDSVGAGVNGYVYALAVYESELVAGGDFLQAGDTSAGRIASWDGQTWSSLGSGLNNEVFDLFACGGELYAGGDFSVAGGAVASKIACWDGYNWTPVGMGFSDGSNDYIRALGIFGENVIAAGQFSRAGTVDALNIAGWNGTEWFTLGSGWVGGISSFEVYSDKLIAAGDFQEIEGVAANRIAAWDGSAWSPLGEGLNGPVNDLLVCDSILIAGGNFTYAGSVSSSNVAYWDGESWNFMGIGFPILFLGSSQGIPIVGADRGSYTYIYGWTGSSWEFIGAPTEPVWDMLYISDFEVYGNELIVGGCFYSISYNSAKNLASWDGSEWSNTGFGGCEVNALGTHKGKLIAGDFCGYLRSWDGSGWSNFTHSFCFGGSFSSFASLGDSLVIGGSFHNPDDCIAVWDGTSVHRLGSGLNAYVDAMQVYNDTLFVAGNFTTAGGKVSAYLARWWKETEVDVMISKLWASTSEKGIKISWSVSADELIEGFRIYRSFDDNIGELIINEELISSDRRSYIDCSAQVDESYTYTLGVVLTDGREVRSAGVEAECPSATAQLFQNTPNPFNPSTRIRFYIPSSEKVQLRIFTPSGRLVKTLIDEVMPAGNNSVTWDGTNRAGSQSSSGLYLYRLRVGKNTLSKKMLLMR